MDWRETNKCKTKQEKPKIYKKKEIKIKFMINITYSIILLKHVLCVVAAINHSCTVGYRPTLRADYLNRNISLNEI